MEGALSTLAGVFSQTSVSSVVQKAVLVCMVGLNRRKRVETKSCISVNGS